MELTRRALIQSSVVIGGAAVLTDLSLSSAAWAVGAPLAPQNTTLAGTLVRGEPGVGGYAPVVVHAGEPHHVRDDLGVPATPTRDSTRTPVLAFAHMTDVHLIDEQSPMRVEYIDRFEDTYGGAPTLGLLQSSYRAHEMLTLHVAEAMVRAINTVGVGPVTNTNLAFALQTGDNADNCQYNEFRWNIDLLDGHKVVAPDSGNKNKYEGVSDNATYDVHYWHPDAPPAGKKADIFKDAFGFPQLPGLLELACKPFAAQGLNMPWYTAFGNHDGLVQGNFPHTLPLGLISTGALKVTSLPPGVSQADVFKAAQTTDPNVLIGAVGPAAPVRLVTPDLNRRELTRAQVVAEHFNTTGSPAGHGFTAKNKKDGTAYYTFDSDNGKVRCIVLDTVNPNGYDNGSLDQTQMTWLTNLLANSKNKYVLVFSHHTSGTMDNPFVATGGDLSTRVLGDAVVTLLLANPNVIAWINGHTHKNQIWARKLATGAGGFWEINTASHVDFPQQSRLIEIVENSDNTLSIFATMVDHSGPAARGTITNDPVVLAGLARELAANDPQQRSSAQEGIPEDRNVELLCPKPAFV